MDTQRYYTFLEAKEASLQFGKGLQNNYGWQHGDVLALFTPNSIDIPIVSWGTHWAGGVVSPANPAYTPDELAYQLTDSGAKLLVTQLPLLATALKAAEASGIPLGRIILIGDQQDCDGRFPHFTSIRGGPGKSYQKAIIKPESDLAFLVYSSGTTGLPKGVMLSHRNIVANILQMHVGDGGNLSWNSGSDGKGDRVLGVLPFYHIYGQCCQRMKTLIIVADESRVNLPGPPGNLFRIAPLCDGQIRFGEMVLPRSKLPHNVRLRRSAYCTSSQQAPTGCQI